MPVADVLDDPAFARLDGISAIVTRCSRSRGDFRDVSSGNDAIQRARQVHDASFVTGANVTVDGGVSASHGQPPLA